MSTILKYKIVNWEIWYTTQRLDTRLLALNSRYSTQWKETIHAIYWNHLNKRKKLLVLKSTLTTQVR